MTLSEVFFPKVLVGKSEMDPQFEFCWNNPNRLQKRLFAYCQMNFLKLSFQ